MCLSITHKLEYTHVSLVSPKQHIEKISNNDKLIGNIYLASNLKFSYLYLKQNIRNFPKDNIYLILTNIYKNKNKYIYSFSRFLGFDFSDSIVNIIIEPYSYVNYYYKYNNSISFSGKRPFNVFDFIETNEFKFKTPICEDYYLNETFYEEKYYIENYINELFKKTKLCLNKKIKKINNTENYCLNPHSTLYSMCDKCDKIKHESMATITKYIDYNIKLLKQKYKLLYDE